MKTLAPLLALALFCTAPAFADWDPALEAREQAKREAEIAKDRERQLEADRMKGEAQAKMDAATVQAKRDHVGAAAKGKSDAEVNALYDAKVKTDTAAGLEAHKRATAAMSSGEGAAALKQVTGKSMADLENMSDAELEAMAEEMQRKYGQ